MLGINKWDLLDKETNTERDYMRAIRERLKTLEYVPIVTISALTGKRIYKILDKALEVHKQRGIRISTSKLNDVMRAAIERTPPPQYRNRPVKIKYVTQVRANPPVITFFCNFPQGVKEPYQRYLSNRLRENFNFEGVPLKLTFKSK